jgi:hypothetical protein
MIKRKIFGTIAALSALSVTQAAQAENSIYEGPCDRAEQVKANNTVDKIMKHATYKGVSLHRYKHDLDAACRTDTAIIRTLSLKSRTTTQATYNMVRKEVRVGSQAEACADLKIHANSTIGTATFTTEFSRVADSCEVYVKVAWDLRDTTSSWTSSFVTRVLVLNDGSLVMAQPGPANGLYNTPIAFSGL